MRRTFAILFVVGVAVALASLLRQTRLEYVAGAPPQLRVVDLRPGQQLCQGPIDLPEGARVERVSLRATGALTITVRDDRDAVLGRGSTRAAGGDLIAPVGAVASPRPVRVCVEGEGSLWGAPATASSFATTLDGTDVIYDLALRLERSHSTRLIAALPRVSARAAVFNAGGPWLYALLGLALLAGVPALLAYAATRSTQSHSPEHSDETS
ncbi:hypothetical protein DVA67_015635 [Solirubrobacter sp. CPCC 204708]|uniref:Uncharacterized protein n=1 Tax=Solirubrobacter deserti TaxID=2282478 RepID=A0ABT4RNA4_9ACTN|nr:hypothetical protein [Solirubrobacter deserti]MBE2317414.1 hypothetical protein [Solirubrobacter deserti]MDA0139996.1 hypothetical protein [Solirubrobacter deserti]